MNDKKRNHLGEVFCNKDNVKFVVIAYTKTWKGYYRLEIVSYEDWEKYFLNE